MVDIIATLTVRKLRHCNYTVFEKVRMVPGMYLRAYCFICIGLYAFGESEKGGSDQWTLEKKGAVSINHYYVKGENALECAWSSAIFFLSRLSVSVEETLITV